MNGVAAPLVVGLGLGSAFGFLLGHPLIGAGIGMTFAIIVAAAIDVFTSRMRSGI